MRGRQSAPACECGRTRRRAMTPKTCTCRCGGEVRQTPVGTGRSIRNCGGSGSWHGTVDPELGGRRSWRSRTIWRPSGRRTWRGWTIGRARERSRQASGGRVTEGEAHFCRYPRWHVSWPCRRCIAGSSTTRPGRTSSRSSAKRKTCRTPIASTSASWSKAYGRSRKALDSGSPR